MRSHQKSLLNKWENRLFIFNYAPKRCQQPAKKLVFLLQSSLVSVTDSFYCCNMISEAISPIIILIWAAKCKTFTASEAIVAHKMFFHPLFLAEFAFSCQCAPFFIFANSSWIMYLMMQEPIVIFYRSYCNRRVHFEFC